MNTTGANWRLWSKRQLHSQRFANFLHCHALVNLIGAWTLVFWYMLVIGLCNVSIISYIVLFWHLTVENSTFNNPMQLKRTPELFVFSVFSDIGGFTCEVPIISAPPSNHIGAKSVPPQSHRRHLQICNKMYFSKLQNVFVQIEKCICQSLPTDNHIGATFRFAAKSHFDKKLWHIAKILRWQCICTLISPILWGECKKSKTGYFPLETLTFAFVLLFPLALFIFFSDGVHCTWVETYCPSNYPSTGHI